MSSHRERHADLRRSLFSERLFVPDTLALAEPPCPAQAIFLTGSTGFLGGLLCRELLGDSDARIYCLVRAKSESIGLNKLKRRLKQAGLRDPSHLDNLTVILGDICQPMFGLSQERYRELAGQIDAIVHSAANVDLVRPCEPLLPANVHGTIEVLKFAVTERLKSVHYLSTTTIFSPSITGPITEDSVADGNGLTMGYSQSKWIAEMLVLEAMMHGLPASVYRSGYLCGDSTTGAFNERGLFNLLWLAARACGMYCPALVPALNLMPVDIAAACIVKLTRSAQHQRRVFHVIHPETITQARHLELLQTHSEGQPGAPLKEVAREDFVNELHERYKKTDHPVFFLLYCLLNAGELTMPNPGIVNHSTMEAVASLGCEVPAVSQEAFAREMALMSAYYRI